ncbi:MULTISPECIES: helix-turn-helix domain-containing protein [unclassified Pseudonocardia]|uniref:helix-turn-helix domain-containing protein n=1 Tax=unclassified Pseudonocardia TaxID=2619320 RepID=UPI0002F9F7F6|nr:helix-turn-helix domain-containing protein [Pseudonocardia sp. Ae707_Ps1]OLM20850.1 hypothetical protein Ae707Ps1_5109c [Pseudonocardia sp. Ae707_Ps1]
MESRADAVTAVIARRVRTLREHARLSGADLADRMIDLGVAWNRTTVAKLETGRRSNVTVSELLALGLALDVPPILLIADPRAGEEVPVAAGTSSDAWSALLWLAGRQRIADSDLNNYPSSSLLIQLGADVVDALAELERWEQHVSWPSAEAQERAKARDDERHRDALEKLQVAVLGLTQKSVVADGAVPTIPGVDFTVASKRAAELGVSVLWDLDGDVGQPEERSS